MNYEYNFNYAITSFMPDCPSYTIIKFVGEWSFNERFIKRIGGKTFKKFKDKPPEAVMRFKRKHKEKFKK